MHIRMHNRASLNERNIRIGDASWQRNEAKAANGWFVENGRRVARTWPRYSGLN